MPCFTVTQTQIELGLSTDADLLERALASLNLHPTANRNGLSFYRGSWNAETGQLTLSGSDAEARGQEIRLAYGDQVATQVAESYGFTVQAVEGEPHKFTLNKL